MLLLHYRVVLPSLVPHVGMEFRDSNEAWAFWLTYSGQKGFEVRKRYTNKRTIDDKVTSCRVVCANGQKGFEVRKRYINKRPQMARSHHVDLFAQMRVNEHKTKGII